KGPALGEGSPSAHHPAPGETRTDGGQVHVRLRNRGLARGRAEVLLYASPAATLIPPERWDFVGSVSVDAVAPGDTLQVAGAASWSPGAFASPEAILPGSDRPGPAWPADAVRGYSFLAVFEGDEPGAAAGTPAPAVRAMRALPPGPPHFDWRRYREFLRGPGVAWKNVHPIAPGAAASLAFFLTGTADRGREFDLEVIQRLPEGASVRLHLPQGLAAKLLQRQPDLGEGSGALTLPRRRSTRFSRVHLPRGLSAPARFDVAAAAGNDLAEGHSLALRQLWRGEEVGRITWYVTAGVP
ncbi:MAG TPA: hypothetical protein VLF66_08260, partial [Thermoanaerobaculia bacterium]|nr:hypothetical protein [Thermoanaerobaculia bacterium]